MKIYFDGFSSHDDPTLCDVDLICVHNKNAPLTSAQELALNELKDQIAAYVINQDGEIIPYQTKEISAVDEIQGENVIKSIMRINDFPTTALKALEECGLIESKNYSNIDPKDIQATEALVDDLVEQSIPELPHP